MNPRLVSKHPQIKYKIVALLCCVGLFLFATKAHADALFVGSQAGLQSFNVDLSQLSSTEMQVTVTLTDGALKFVNTGSNNHPGFAFNLSGDPSSGVSVSNISSPWTLSDVNLSSFTTNGPSFGTFDFYISNPGNGGNANNAGPLVFDITDTAGLSFSSFVKNSDGYYFVADIMDSNGNTGTSAISNGPTTTPPVIPEPSTLVLLGTGLAFLAGGLKLKHLA